MMQFANGAAMAEHLSALIQDEDLVLEAVRRRFPNYGSCPSKRTISVSHNLDCWAASDVSDRALRKSMEMSSKSLLSALQREHPAIVDHLTRRA